MPWGEEWLKSRAWLAESYNRLAKLWQRSDYINHESLNITRASLLLRKINDLLWASRYSALVGKYELACSLAHESLQEAKTALRSEQTNEKEFLQFIAEAYHVLSSRIEVERKNYHRAISFGNVALRYRISPDWRERFLWYNGLYYYLLADWQKAAEFWQAGLQQFPTSSVRPRLLFWLARASTKMAMETVAEDRALKLRAKEESLLRELETAHPLSYYSVFALGTVSEHAPWYERHHLPNLQRALDENRGIDLDSYRRHHKFGRILLRAEIFISARTLSLAQIELRELEEGLAQERSPAPTKQGLRLYLTRLYAMSYNYLRGIILTARMVEKEKSYWQKWPEQLLIYFPMPFSAIFKREAFATEMEPGILLAVARQESAFNAGARGGVQEGGLMQLLPSTAMRVARDNNIEVFDINRQLLIPDINIKLGALYLRSLFSRYRDNLSAVFASYNAGEEAVNAWLQRRTHADPLIWVELIPFSTTKKYVKKRASQPCYLPFPD